MRYPSTETVWQVNIKKGLIGTLSVFHAPQDGDDVIFTGEQGIITGYETANDEDHTV